MNGLLLPKVKTQFPLILLSFVKNKRIEPERLTLLEFGEPQNWVKALTIYTLDFGRELRAGARNFDLYLLELFRCWIWVELDKSYKSFSISECNFLKRLFHIYFDVLENLGAVMIHLIYYFQVFIISVYFKTWMPNLNRSCRLLYFFLLLPFFRS